ncbi:titin [Oryzias melastigma]|uniref:titin n=1 Tax=Oryzias melastigma TaxID=30732 RepID=UPI00168CF848|nr:titin [Oryzias melastigma]
MSLQVCHCCGWSKVTSYQGLRIHQGMKGCTPKGMRVMEHQQQDLFGQRNSMLDFGRCVIPENLEWNDLSLQVHQGMMGRTSNGMRQHQNLCGQTVQSNFMLDFGFCIETEVLDSPDLSLQVCHCGWTKMTTYKELQIHQGEMGCTLKGMRVMEHQQQYFRNQTVQSNVMLDFDFCVETENLDSPDLSLQVCHCGWTRRTTYRGLRIHQGRMGCTVKGARIPKTKSYDSKYNRKEREHQRGPRAEKVPEGLRRSSRKSSAAAKISSPEPPRSAQRANSARYLEAEQVLIQNGVSGEMRINPRIERERRSRPEAPVWRTAERVPEHQRQDFCSNLQVQKPFREPRADPESQLRERCRSQQVDRAVRSPSHVVQSKKRHRSVVHPKNRDPPVFQPKNRDPPVVRPKNKGPPVVLLKNKDPPVVRPKDRGLPVVSVEDRYSLVVRSKNKGPPVDLPKNRVVLSEEKNPPVIPPKNREPPVVLPENKAVLPKNRDSSEIWPGNRDAPLVLPKNRVPPVVPTKKRVPPEALPENRDPPVQEEKRQHLVLVELQNALQRKQSLRQEQERELEASTKDVATMELNASVKMVIKGNQSASRTSLRKCGNISTDQENRSPHPVIKTEIESSLFTAKLEKFKRISVGAGAQPTIKVKQEVNTSKPPVPPKPKVLPASSSVTAVQLQEEKAKNQRVTDITAAAKPSTPSVQDPASFSEVDSSAAMKVKDLAQMFSGSCDKKEFNQKKKPKEEDQPSQKVKETTNTEESSQAEVSQEVPLPSEPHAFITGMKVKELLQVFKSVDSKTSKKEQQLLEVKTCRISFAIKEETKTNREEQKEVKTFRDVITAVSKPTEEMKPTKSLKVKELVQMFSASSVPPKEKLEGSRKPAAYTRTCPEPAAVRRGRN